MRVVLYTRPGCHLCDVARDVVLSERARAELGGAESGGGAFEFEEIDITGDDALELEYGIRIPVVLVDGVERFEIQVDPGALAALVNLRDRPGPR